MEGVFAVTESVRVVDAWTPPPLPLSVTVALPVVALLMAVKVSVAVTDEDPVMFTEAGASVTPAGKPLVVRDTVPVIPPEGVTVSVVCTVLP